ncbi:helix-turn-helix transcriptional regulator [Paenibacillus sp. SYP-B3998]|uniref:Helix-turn-helix transcriptional regulator n=1 Tax=Paenibacillus sp. SYP-B3998 TaxID=2678564 RepID=A0A6G3ZXD2_9BACL|nr:helix-turn-helix transcriptional regulator [Paenibacillus sp. SYP-B3998]NEW06873.1 helix-turn-helix transcriptional regulator [Paenibacillus sp. SYP-B3998]
MVSLAKLVGERIRQLRKLKKMSQEQLGELAQLQSSYIGGVERGERNVSLETLEKIIRALDLSYSQFFSFGEIGVSDKLSKEELIEVFSGELMTNELTEVRRIFEVYNIIKRGK